MQKCPRKLTFVKSQARYITRPALAMDALQKLDDGNLVLETPPDPKSGATTIMLDPLEWIHFYRYRVNRACEIAVIQMLP